MRSQFVAFSILALLACACASPHDEDSDTVSAAKITKTVIVTITHTGDETSTTRAPVPTDPALICPMPNLPCIIDGIPIWPNNTSVPKFTLDPSSIPTRKTTLSSSTISLSHRVSSTTIKASTNTITSSASASKDTMSSKCDHSMSHWAPGERNSTSWTTTITEPISSASVTTSTLPAVSDTASERKDYSANAAETTPTDAEATTDVIDSVAWAGMDGALMTRAKREIESSAQRRRKTFWSRLFVAAHPQTPMQIVRDEDEDDDQDDFTHGNEPDVKMACVTCPKGRSIVCIDSGYYGNCDEGCAEPRKLKERMKCVDGRIYGARLYHDGG
jgi:hypothetical protein